MPKKGTDSQKRAGVSSEIEQKVLENIVELQKIEANLAEKFEKLSEQISRLLVLFEMAARDFGKQPLAKDTERDKEFTEKIDLLLEQNKVLAKGIMLIEEKMSSQPAPVHHVQPHQPQAPGAPVEQEQHAPPYFKPSPSGRPLPRF